MATLRERGLDEALRVRAAASRPTLGICLGLQLALEETDEDGGVTGLGLLPGRAVRLRGRRVPRIGWAPVDGADAFYFAHSYVAETPAATA
jgi:imidazole glycerol-phosphate synthase subunit HisH